MDEAPGMTLIVRIVTRWLFGLVIIFGLGLAFYGHLTPGGGFAGGVVVACAFVMATLAFGRGRGPHDWMRRAASNLDATGALAFLALGLLGYLAGHFLQRWVPIGEPFALNSALHQVLINLAILLKVGAGLFAGFVAIAIFDEAGQDAQESGGEA